jgi:hypothetical protein
MQQGGEREGQPRAEPFLRDTEDYPRRMISSTKAPAPSFAGNTKATIHAFACVTR